MLDAKDLRIGNLVLVHNHYVAAVERIGKDIGVKTYGETISQIDYIELQYLTPIELTEEWLLRFGYTEEDFTSGKILIVQENGVDAGFIICNLSKSKIFKHVHKLQNFHYELNDTELTLKEIPANND